MDNTELEETVRALYGLCIAQDGMLQAQQAILNAVIGGIGTTLPQTLNATAEGLTQLEALVRPTIQPGALAAFETTIANFHHGLNVLKR